MLKNEVRLLALSIQWIQNVEAPHIRSISVQPVSSPDTTLSRGARGLGTRDCTAYSKLRLAMNM